MSELLTVREVAERLRVDQATVRRWLKAGTLSCVELPHKGRRTSYRIQSEDIDALLKGNGNHA